MHEPDHAAGGDVHHEVVSSAPEADGPRSHRSPREAAKALGVSPSGLRRLAEIYAREYGDLPRDPATKARVWPPEALQRLAAARSLVRGGRAESIREAFALAANWPAADTMPLAAGDDDVSLRDLVVEVRQLRDELALVRRELEALRELVSVAAAGPARLELERAQRRLRYLQTELEHREL